MKLRPSVILAAMVLAATALPLPAETPSTAAGWLPDLEEVLAGSGLSINATNASKAALLAAVKTMDARAEILSAEAWADIQSRREGLFLMPGIRLGITNGLPVVQELPTNSPAALAGLAAGDQLVGIGTQHVDRIRLPDALQRLKAGDEPALTLHYVRGGATNRAEVIRERMNEPAIETAELLPNNIGYIKINGLYPGSGRDVVSRIRAWSENQRDGIVLDLRGAGGYDAAAATQVASLFARGGQFLFAFRDHNQQDIASFRATEGHPVEQPIIVLIDRSTRDAAEVLAAAINGSTRAALLIGEATAGDFMLREPVEIGGYSILLARQVLDTADGIRFTGQHGLEPMIPLSPSELDTRDYEPPVNLLDKRGKMDVELRDASVRRRVRGDGALERAVDIIIGLKTLNKQGVKVSSGQ